MSITTPTYSTVTQKGQVTLPKALRDKFGIKAQKRVQITAGKEYIKIKPVLDIVDLAGKYKAPKGKNALKAREYMEKHYERV